MIFVKCSQGVMAITKCRIWSHPVNGLTGATTALSQCARTSNPFAGQMERENYDHGN